MFPYIDIHTHRKKQLNNSIQIIDISNQFNIELPEKDLYAMGIHPWFIDENWEHKLAEIESYLKLNNVVAIGECGLDFIRGPAIEIQKNVFESQLKMAQREKKPVILHCVKAENELFNIIKPFSSTIPFIFHGYNQNEIIAQKFISMGVYLSIGNRFLNKKANVISKTINSIPIDKLFFETDDAAIEIQHIYQSFANFANIELEELKKQIYFNYLKIFGKPND